MASFNWPPEGSSSSGGIVSINSDATAAQTLSVGTTGTDFAIVDGGSGAHTFNLPNASATARGVVSTGTQTIAGDKTFSGVVAIGKQAYSAVGTTVTPVGTTATIDWNTGNTQVLDLSSASGDVTVTLSNGNNGGVYTLYVLQGGTTRNVVITAKWPGGIPPVITPTASAVDILSFSVRGGLYYGVFNQAFS